MRSKLGSKSFNDLDDSEQFTPSSSATAAAAAAAAKAGSVRGLRSSMSFHGLLGSNGDSAGGQVRAFSWCVYARALRLAFLFLFFGVVL